MQRLIERCQRAGRVALALRPAGYDAEVVYLMTLLQSLGRLVVHYHFPDEAAQIRRLMQPAPSAREGEPEAIDRDFAIMLHNWALPTGASRPDPSVMTDFDLWTLNSKVFPATDPLVVRTGQRVRIRIVTPFA